MVKIVVLLAVLLHTIIIIRVISVLKKKDLNNTPDEQIFYSENEFETFDWKAIRYRVKTKSANTIKTAVSVILPAVLCTRTMKSNNHNASPNFSSIMKINNSPKQLINIRAANHITPKSTIYIGSVAVCPEYISKSILPIMNEYSHFEKHILLEIQILNIVNPAISYFFPFFPT